MAACLLEEVYELIDAIEQGKPDDVCEELGDVFFHIFFIAHLFSESGQFDINDVARMNTEKMIRRHPHVFGEDSVDSAEEVKKRWNVIKKNEKNHAEKESILDSVPKALPALMRAYSMSERAARSGFDWNDISGVKRKVEEEWAELDAAYSKKNQEDVSLEFGDMLFTLVNFARFAHIHPETALLSSISKFEKRFKYMEKAFSKQEKQMESASFDEMDKMWEEAKKNS